MRAATRCIAATDPASDRPRLYRRYHFRKVIHPVRANDVIAAKPPYRRSFTHDPDDF